jgi:CrcB protein
VTLVGIAVAGALGALARYGVQSLAGPPTGTGFPWATFVVNISGAFVLGLLFTLFGARWLADPWLRSTLMIGFLGSYTTFSTLSLDSYRLLEHGAVPLALANLLGSCAAGLGAVYLGVLLGRAL